MKKTMLYSRINSLVIVFFLLIVTCSPFLLGIHVKDTGFNLYDRNSNDIIYLTGFTPFLNYLVNPSELVVNELNQTMIQNYTIYGRVLPVNFTCAPTIIQNDIDHLDPCLIILLGLDPSADSITIELLSVNLQYDASMNEPLKTLKRIDKDGPFFIPTRLDTREMYLDLKGNDIPVSYSLSAGFYVCNAVFYETLYYLSKESLDTPMGFIHIPQIENDNSSGMKTDDIFDGVLTMILSNLK